MRTLYRKFLRLRTFIFTLSLVSCIPTSGHAQESAGPGRAGVSHESDLSEIAALGLEELLDQEVTSVLRKEQSVADSAAAIYVLTAEELHRSGATSIPEALRLVPGLAVSRIGANTWIVTARGYDIFGNSRLLVLIDGRSVYDPLFAGVFWDVQDLVLEDIERIEVIRGPGAVSWGENAVNGVINIITKSAEKTQGPLASGIIGNEERGTGVARYGGAIGPDSSYRIYGKYVRLDDNPEATPPDHTPGESHEDQFESARGGFRIDAAPSPSDVVTFQGDIYKGNAHNRQTLFESLEPPYVFLRRNHTNEAGGNLLFRYTSTVSTDSEFAVQTYYDRAERHDLTAGYNRDSWDLDAQHRYRFNDRHDLVYGANYRLISDRLTDSFAVDWREDSRTDQLSTFFIQDEITLAKDYLHVIPGTKVGYNTYSHFEAQPAIKAVGKPSNDLTIWSSLARAVRIPTRFTEDLTQVLPPTGAPGEEQYLVLEGSRSMESEELLAYEIGVRTPIGSEVTLDVATFYHDYDNVVSAATAPPAIKEFHGTDIATVPVIFNNGIEGESYGSEVLLNWRPDPALNFTATYAYIDSSFSRSSDVGIDPLVDTLSSRSPSNQASLRAHLNLPMHIEFDTMLYYVDSIPAFDISSYIRTDIRLAWHPHPDWELEFVVQNLLDDSHAEYSSPRGVEIERSLFTRVTYRLD